MQCVSGVFKAYLSLLYVFGVGLSSQQIQVTYLMRFSRVLIFMFGVVMVTAWSAAEMFTNLRGIEQVVPGCKLPVCGLLNLLPNLAFIAMFVWLQWVNFGTDFEHIFGRTSVMWRLNIRHDVAKRLNFEIKLIFAAILLVEFVCVLFDSDNFRLILNGNTPFHLAYSWFYFGVYQSSKFLLPVVCCCFYIAICNLVCAEMDRMGSEILAVKSPYKVGRVVEKCMVRYRKLEVLSRGINETFSLVPVICGVSYWLVMAVVFPVHASGIVKIEHLIDEFSWGIVASFVFSLYAIYAASKANRKVLI